MSLMCLTAKEAAALFVQRARLHKFNARPVKRGERPDGLSFASTEEARQYDILRQREWAGEIVAGSIRTQVRFSLNVEGVHICDYIADFVCRETKAPEREVVIDAKGVRTDAYKIKKALMLACHRVAIREVGRQRKAAKKKPPRGKTRRPQERCMTALGGP